jgi:hypothetical protein
VREGFEHGPIPAKIEQTYHVSEQLVVEGAASGQIDWAGQGSDGAVYLLGRLDEGTEWSLVKDKNIQCSVPAVLSDGAEWKATVHLSNGKTESESYKIVGVEKVKTGSVNSKPTKQGC